MSMDILASILLDHMLQPNPPAQISDKNVAENSIRRSLLVELSFIEQTSDHLLKICDYSSLWDTLSEEEKNEFIEEVKSDYKAIDNIPDDKGEFYKIMSRNIALLSIAQSANGRLSTTLYEANAPLIGILSFEEINMIVQIYSVINIAKELLIKVGENLRRHGLFPKEFLSGDAATERDILLQEIEHVTNTLVENLPLAQDVLTGDA